METIRDAPGEIGGDLAVRWAEAGAEIAPLPSAQAPSVRVQPDRVEVRAAERFARVSLRGARPGNPVAATENGEALLWAGPAGVVLVVDVFGQPREAPISPAHPVRLAIARGPAGRYAVAFDDTAPGHPARRRLAVVSCTVSR